MFPLEKFPKDTYVLAKGYKVFSADELEKLEVPNPKVSSKYKPIKTSKFLKSTKMPFKYGFKKGSRQIVIGGDEKLNCVIENSFDGSLAFRTYFSDGNITFGSVRQIHKGEHAQGIEKMSKEFAKTFHNAASVLPKLQNMILPLETKKQLFKKAFELRGFKNRLHVLETNIDQYPNNAYYFLVDLFKDLKEGNFYYTTSKTRKGRKINNEFKNLEIQRKIWDKFKELHVEMYF